MFLKNILIRRSIFTAAVALALIALGGAITATSAMAKFEKMEKELSAPVLIPVDESSDKIYIVKEYHGKLGIFDADGSILYTTEVYTKTLPAADRKLLIEGIRAEGREELYEILGDYDS